MNIAYIRRSSTSLAIIVLIILILLQTYTHLLAQQYVISSYQGVKDIYEVVIYDDHNFTAFLSDVHTMTNYGEFFGIKVSRGMIEEILVTKQGDNNIYRILVEEELKPAIDGEDIVYEFAGYYVRKRSGSAYVQTLLLQNFRGFLHTACLDTNFTLIFRFMNSSKVFEYSTTLVKALVLNFRTFTITFLAEVNATEVVINEADNSTIIRYISKYPCLSIAGVARFDIEDLMFLLNNISMVDIYRYVDGSKDLYLKYILALPRLKVGAKVVQDLYYVSLYNRLNTLFYPEVYGDVGLSRFANYIMSMKILRLSSREFHETLDKLFTKLNLSNLYDIFVGLEIAKFLNDKERLDAICSNVEKLISVNNSIEIAILSRALSTCGTKNSKEKELTTASLLNLPPSDILALLELGIVSPSLLQIIRIDKLPTPDSCWRCLSYSQAIKLLEPSLTDILLHLRNTRVKYICVDYIVIAVFGGIDLTNNDVLLFTPTIPAPNEVLYIVIKVKDSDVNLIYNGWGKEVKGVRVNGVSIDMIAIPISMLKDKVNTIEIEMVKKVIKLNVVVMNNGVPLEGIPVYVSVAQREAGYDMLSITDSGGKATFVVRPQSYLVILVNVPELGLLRLKTWVSDRDSDIVIDISEMLSKLSYINTSIHFLEKRILDLEKSIETIKFRTTTTQTPSQDISTNRVYEVLSSIALSSSAIALGVALVNIRRRGV